MVQNESCLPVIELSVVELSVPASVFGSSNG